ncbi:MAG: flagellar hook protein FlgE [Deltaproteobacteria bacterium]|nr:flagellar hook protein FlgE [Deltaproteobacteria bacterium]
MRIESALFSSKEGLTANGQAIAVVGDNIANSNTTAYKTSRVEFGDLFAAGKDATFPDALPQAGSGVQVNRVRQIHETGVIEATGRPLDVGIAGDGFFMSGDIESPLYTRAGNFSINSEGLLVTADGQPILGLQGSGTTLGTLNLKNIAAAGSPTSAVALFGNLNSSAAVSTVPTTPATFNEITSAASFVVPSLEVHDSLGVSHGVTLAFFKGASNSWTAHAYMDGGDLGQTAGVPVEVGSATTLAFSSSGVILDADKAAAKMTVNAAYTGGAAAGNFTIDLSSFSQFAGSSGVNSLTQDGQSAGNVKSYEFLKTGQLNAVMDNGTIVQIGTVQLAQFPNVDGLQRAGNAAFRTSDSSGKPVISNPGSEGTGTLESASLERSTVDLANQFVDLVLYQRGYQANSQTFGAANQLIQSTIALIR